MCKYFFWEYNYFQIDPIRVFLLQKRLNFVIVCWTITFISVYFYFASAVICLFFFADHGVSVSKLTRFPRFGSIISLRYTPKRRDSHNFLLNRHFCRRSSEPTSKVCVWFKWGALYEDFSKTCAFHSKYISYFLHWKNKFDEK